MTVLREISCQNIRRFLFHAEICFEGSFPGLRGVAENDGAVGGALEVHHHSGIIRARTGRDDWGDEGCVGCDGGESRRGVGVGSRCALVQNHCSRVFFLVKQNFVFNNR
jgi:hypothetical protein